MHKALLFYTIGEYTSVERYCKRKGLKPFKTIMKTLDNQPFPVVTQYSKGEYIYDVLGYQDCYSGYMVTLMRLPQLAYQELLNVALTSHNSDERAGATGILLKDYPREFEDFLLMVSEKNIVDKQEKRQILRLTRFILDFVCAYTSYVQDMGTVISLCQMISSGQERGPGLRRCFKSKPE